MSQKLEGNLRMTSIEASERFPDSYIVMCRDNLEEAYSMGTVLFVTDNDREAYSFLMKLDDPRPCGVSEGLNLQRSFGGILIGE